MGKDNPILDQFTKSDYRYGFTSPIAQNIHKAGLNEEVIRFIAREKKEPEWMLAWRLAALAKWQKMKEPSWGNVYYPPIDYQKISYYAAPKKGKALKSLDDLDPAILTTFEKLGIPLAEQKRLAGVAVDAVLDSVSVGTTFKEELAKQGIIFCSFSEAIQKHPHLVRQYMGRVIAVEDNYFSALNAAVFSDGSFCYIPAGVRCPMALSTYFRINAAQTGQFERTLIVAEEDSFVEYLEGCTAPMREEHQLHTAVVEIYAKARAEVRYSTIQNWYPGNKEGQGGIYNFVIKRGLCAGEASKISWVQLETGSAITWKYPSCILKGDRSVGEFYSVAMSRNRQQADTGTKMIHIGKETRSKIIAKGISAGYGKNTYRGLVKFNPTALNSYNFSQCDSLLIGDQCSAYTIPYILGEHPTATVHHEASTAKIDEEQLFYCQQRGMTNEEAHTLLATGFCDPILKRLPMEFAIEAQKLLGITLEGSVG